MSLTWRFLAWRFPTLLGVLAASPALARSDATSIPPPPTLVQPDFVLLVFLAIFVAAGWSLSALMGQPVRLKPRRRHRASFWTD